MNNAASHIDFFNVYVDYGDGPSISPHHAKKLRFTFENTYKLQANLNLRWYVNGQFSVTPSPVSQVFVPVGFKNTTEIEFELQFGELSTHQYRAVSEITLDGRPTVMLVPILLTVN